MADIALLLLAGERHHGRPAHAVTDDEHAAKLAERAFFLLPDHALDRRRATAAILLGPLQAGPAGIGLLLLPGFCHFKDVGALERGSAERGFAKLFLVLFRRVGRDPRLGLSAERGFLRGVIEVHMRRPCSSFRQSTPYPCRVAPPPDTVWFLSDYGLEDEFVGVVKGVVKAIAPEVTVVDLTHRIPAYDVAGRLARPRPQHAVPQPGRCPGRRSHRRGVSNRRRWRWRWVATTAPLPSSSAPTTGCWPRPWPWWAAPDGRYPLTNPDYQIPAPGPTFAGRGMMRAGRRPPVRRSSSSTLLGEPVDPLPLLPGIIPLSREEDGRTVGEVL